MHNSYTRKALAAAVLALVCGAGTAQAVDEVATYTLNDVTFADGATATGSFAFDLTTDKLSSWGIVVSAVNFLGTNVPAKFFFSSVPGGSASYPFSTGTPPVVSPNLGFTFYSDASQQNWLTLGFGGRPPAAPGVGLAGAPLSVLLTSGSERVLVPSGPTIASSINLGGDTSVIRTGLVGAVPEPSSVALMLAGLVVVGATLRRRSAT